MRTILGFTPVLLCAGAMVVIMRIGARQRHQEPPGPSDVSVPTTARSTSEPDDG